MAADGAVWMIGPSGVLEPGTLGQAVRCLYQWAGSCTIRHGADYGAAASSSIS